MLSQLHMQREGLHATETDADAHTEAGVGGSFSQCPPHPPPLRPRPGLQPLAGPDRLSPLPGPVAQGGLESAAVLPRCLLALAWKGGVSSALLTQGRGESGGRVVGAAGGTGAVLLTGYGVIKHLPQVPNCSLARRSLYFRASYCSASVLVFLLRQGAWLGLCRVLGAVKGRAGTGGEVLIYCTQEKKSKKTFLMLPLQLRGQESCGRVWQERVTCERPDDSNGPDQDSRVTGWPQAPPCRPSLGDTATASWPL